MPVCAGQFHVHCTFGLVLQRRGLLPQQHGIFFKVGEETGLTKQLAYRVVILFQAKMSFQRVTGLVDSRIGLQVGSRRTG